MIKSVWSLFLPDRRQAVLVLCRVVFFFFFALQNELGDLVRTATLFTTFQIAQ